MLGFVPTSAQNQRLRREHSDRLTRTRRDNLEHMQKLMAAAAEAGMEITPEWLASQESAMMTPELMAMGISPREAVTHQMVEAANKKAEEARLYQEIAKLQKTEEADGMLANYVMGQLRSGKDESQIGAGLVQQFPLLGKDLGDRLPQIISTSKGRMAATIMADPRIPTYIDPDDLPDDLRLAATDPALRNIVTRQRDTYLTAASSELFAGIQGSTTPLQYDQMAETARKWFENKGINYKDKDVDAVVTRAVAQYNQDNVQFNRQIVQTTAPQVVAGGFSMQERDETAAAQQRQLAAQRRSEAMSVFDAQVASVDEMFKDNRKAAPHIPALKSIVHNNQITGAAHVKLMNAVSNGENPYTVFENLMRSHPDDIATKTDVSLQSQIAYDASSGEMSKEQFTRRYTEYFADDYEDALRKHDAQVAAGRLSSDPALRAAHTRRFQTAIEGIKTLSESIRIPEIRSWQQPPSQVPLPWTQGRQQPTSAQVPPQNLPVYPEEAVASLSPRARQFLPIIAHAAQTSGVPVSWMMALAETESTFRADAFNRENDDSGLFQFIPDTARRYNLEDPFDPVQNASAAARMFADHFAHGMRKFGGNPELALEEAIRSHQAGMSGNDRGERNQEHFERTIANQRKYAHLDRTQPIAAQAQGQWGSGAMSPRVQALLEGTQQTPTSTVDVSVAPPASNNAPTQFNTNDIGAELERLSTLRQEMMGGRGRVSANRQQLDEINRAISFLEMQLQANRPRPNRRTTSGR